MNIAPADIQNSERKSGYDHVAKQEPRPGSITVARFRAQAGGRRADRGSASWMGPYRATAAEAAQDYCDYLNTGGVATPASLRSAGHNGARARVVPVDEEEAAALGVLRDKRAQRRKKSKAKGYVYCITDGTAVKIGYSLKPEARVAELQTGNPRRLTLLATMQGTPTDEKALHVRYLRANILQEWFRPTRKLLSEFGLTKEAINA